MNSKTKIEEVAYDVGTMTFRGLACGEANQKIVLCLHGWLDNAASFTPIMPYLEGYRVIAIDWTGHGLSSHRSQDAHYHFIDWVYDLLKLFDHNQWENIDIVAHSMGGMIATAFAAAFPEKVKSLMLIDSIGFLSAKAEQTTDQLRQGMLSRLKGRDKKKNIHLSIESAVKARVAVSDLAYEQAEIIVNRGIEHVEGGLTWRSDSRLRLTSPYRLTLAQAEQFIHDIKCPVQLIHGAKGMDMVVSGIKHFGPIFKNFTYHELQGGHHIHMEQPEQTSALINDFLIKS